MKNLTQFERIKQVLDNLGLSVSMAERQAGIGGAISKLNQRKKKGVEGGGELSPDILGRFLRTFHVNPDYIKNGEGDMFLDDAKKIEAKEPQLEYGLSKDIGEVYRNIVEGNTEYVLILRSVLQDKYRIVAVEQIELEARTIDRLLLANEKLIDAIGSVHESKKG